MSGLAAFMNPTYTEKTAEVFVSDRFLDDDGKPTGGTRILGQAYVWYDPETKTVCYDNIEIPTKILDELKKESIASIKAYQYDFVFPLVLSYKNKESYNQKLNLYVYLLLLV